MARKEWIQLKRDPRSMILAFVLPTFMLVFFGYAISFDIDDIGLAVHKLKSLAGLNTRAMALLADRKKTLPRSKRN